MEGRSPLQVPMFIAMAFKLLDLATLLFAQYTDLNLLLPRVPPFLQTALELPELATRSLVEPLLVLAVQTLILVDMKYDENGCPVLTFEERFQRYFAWLDRTDPKNALHDPRVRALKYFRSAAQSQQLSSSKAQELLEHRDRLRKEKRWAEADQIRQELEGMRYRVVDTESGSKLSNL